MLLLFSVSNSFVTLWTIANQVTLSMGFPKQEYWSGSQFPSPGDLPELGVEAVSPALVGDSLPLSHQGNIYIYKYIIYTHIFYM